VIEIENIAEFDQRAYMRTMFGYIGKLDGYAKWVRIYYVRRDL
jgi:hypothetical protein